MSPASYYRWRQEAAGGATAAPPRPVQAYEATDEEKLAVRAYALKHPGIRHRELAWRMVDEEVASVESVDGVPDFEGGEPGLSVEEKEEADPGGGGEAQRPDEIWATDLMYVQIGGANVLLGDVPGRVLAADRASRTAVRAWTGSR